MKFYDITLTLDQDTINYPGDTPFAVEPQKAIAAGDNCNLTKLVMSSHCGTHIDAPAHFFDQGLTIDEIGLEKFYGQVKLIDLTAESTQINAEMLSAHLEKGLKKVLLKTKGSELLAKKEFSKDYPHLVLDGAKLLLESGIELVGIDYLTIEAFESAGYPVHNLLLKNQVLILEGLDLRAVQEGYYTLCAFPLKVRKGDGTPLRAVLIAE